MHSTQRALIKTDNNCLHVLKVLCIIKKFSTKLYLISENFSATIRQDMILVFLCLREPYETVVSYIQHLIAMRLFSSVAFLSVTYRVKCYSNHMVTENYINIVSLNVICYSSATNTHH